MAKFVIKNVWCQINSVDLSDRVRQVEVTTNVASVDAATMTTTDPAGSDFLVGLRNDSFRFTFSQDFGAGEVDATLWPLFNGGSSFLVEVAHAGTAISATNPKYSGTVVLTDYQPVAGQIGALGEAQVVMPVSGVIARATA